MDHEQRYQNLRKVTLIGAGVDILLSIFKIVFGIIGHSQALVTDGIHSLSDLFTDFMVLMAAKWGNVKPDLEHPYGHGRIETLATLIMAMIIIAVGFGFGYDAWIDILSSETRPSPGISVLIVAFLSMVIKEWLFHYTLKTTGSISFDLAHSNAWHHRSDALASGIVLVGVLGTLLGFKHADRIAAILVCLFIIQIGLQMIWNSLRELIDTGVNHDTLEKIKKCIQETPGVLSIHQLRTRSMGSRIFVDVHLMVSPLISVSEGHYIGDQVSLNLKKDISQIYDVTVHIDHENDELFMISSQLPNRETIEAELKSILTELPYHEEIQNIKLHYIGGKIKIEISIGLEGKQFLQASQLAEQYQNAVKKVSYIDDVAVLFYCRALNDGAS